METDVSIDEVSKVEEVKELLDKYPHMNAVEPEKLGWIGELPPAKPPPSDSPYQARFDFEGITMLCISF